MLALILFAQLAAGEIRVVDGDTLDFGGVRYRVAALDAPSPQARCPAERERAAAATAEVERLVRTARRVEAFPTGVVQPATQRYRRPRTIARIEIDGRDLTEHMIARGLGRRWPNGESWC